MLYLSQIKVIKYIDDTALLLFFYLFICFLYGSVVVNSFLIVTPVVEVLFVCFVVRYFMTIQVLQSS